MPGPGPPAAEPTGHRSTPRTARALSDASTEQLAWRRVTARHGDRTLVDEGSEQI
ncbi:hypothetical protein [Streptomyces sp. NPDC042319]|uniref:hypothetical protein n=1 Tax=Streptomyces sp. NPDC042319 TaxID=3154332 RepID=UPI0034014B3C